MENTYQKYEYLKIVNDKIDYDHSAFIEIVKDSNDVSFTLNTTPKEQKMNFITETDTFFINGNKAGTCLDKLKTLSEINGIFEKNSK